jgi:hypothetical protein
MIIWIASFPKSGNTWVRSIISSLIYSDDGIFNFELLKKIQQFPKRNHFVNFTKKYQDPHSLKKFWIAAQDKINLDNKIKFLKTHHINCKIGEYSFTNKINTLGTIYVVRDPRNLINSFSNHYGIDKNVAKKTITSQNFVTGAIYKQDKQNNIFTIIGSWKDHYNSWTKFNNNLLILKYEDLLMNPEEELNKIIRYLNKFEDFKNLNHDNQKIKNILHTTTFEVLQKKEAKEGFFEAVPNKLNEKKVKFFNQGKNNNWTKHLDKEDINYIESNFRTEMRELGYL